MIFPRNKLVPVHYVIDTPEGNDFIPKGIYPNVEKQHAALGIGCPAIAALNNKLFYVCSPIKFDLIFGFDESDEPYWKYEFDTKEHRDWKGRSVHTILDNALTESFGGNCFSMQLNMPYAFITDEPGLSLTMLPPNSIQYENCSFVGGEFFMTDWIRHMSSGWVLLDESKPAVVHFELDKPCMLIYFNKQINLSYAEPTEEQHSYMRQTSHVTFYKNNAVGSLFANIKSRRPKRLLAKKRRLG